MKFKILTLLVLSSLGWQAPAITNGVSVDLKNGLGYTMFADRFWGGISLNAVHRRFVDNQIVVSPRVYANFNICEHQGVGFFTGASYADAFGLSNDRIINKPRIFALTLGLTSKIADNFRLSGWVNAWGVHEDLIYDSTTGRQVFDSSTNRRSYMDFGGLLLTYLF